MEIIKGKIPTAKKVVVYGPEGIGKTTLASKFPDPLFIDTEGGTKTMDVARLPKPVSWEELKREVEWVAHEKPCKTLVIDTADWAEALCTDYVCSTKKKSGIEDFGYGKGYVYVMEEFHKLLDMLDKIVESGINVLITAHAAMRKFEQPDEMGAYDRWELKLSKKCSPLLKEWPDMLLFCNYKTYVVKSESGARKAQGGKRVMYASHNPCWDAKNRFGLPDELDMDYKQIKGAIEDDVSEPESSEIPESLAKLMEESDICEWDIQNFASAKGWVDSTTEIKDYPAKVIKALITQWDKVTKLIKEMKDKQEVPFNE